MSTKPNSSDASTPAESVAYEPGKIYRLRYRLAGQKKDRYAQLQSLGDQGDTKLFSGRPTIGNVVLRNSEILWREQLPPGFTAWTCWDKKEPPWHPNSGGA